MRRWRFSSYSSVAAAAGDADAVAWRAAVITAGGTVSGAQFGYVSALISGLKADGVWSSLDRLWLFAAENSTQARRDLVARVAASLQNGPTFTANRGYTGDGLSAYVDSNFNPASGTPKYSQNDASFGVWIETATSSATGSPAYIGNAGANYNMLYHPTGTTNNFGVNATGPQSWTVSPSTGHFHAQRTASNAQAIYQNGASVKTGTDASAALESFTFVALANNNRGAIEQPSDARESAIWLGKSLTTGQITAFYNRMRTYMTAVGVS
jgi:hypothetical protein